MSNQYTDTYIWTSYWNFFKSQDYTIYLKKLKLTITTIKLKPSYEIKANISSYWKNVKYVFQKIILKFKP